MTMAMLGIDISKQTFDATFIDDTGTRHHRQFTHNASGFQALHQWLNTHAVSTLHACMEATNISGEDLADDLFQHGDQVSVVNPARTKGVAISQLQRHKTDKVDSGVVADFCDRMTPTRWTPPSAEQRQLRDLVRHLEGVKKTKTQHPNRLHTCRNPVGQHSLQTMLDLLEAQMLDRETQIDALFQAHPPLKAQRALLSSIPGIGTTTATTILAEMADREHYQDARAAAADAGVTPAHYESGTSVRRRPRLSKIGNVSIRGALYWPAITAMHHNPMIRQVKERLDHKGNHKNVILGAAMRKRLHLAYGVLKHTTRFDPEYGHKPTPMSPANVCQAT
jgi:transposase